MKDTLQCYKVLDIEPGSSVERVRRAYVDLVRTWDPERYVGNPLLLAEAEKKRKEIEEAYQALRFFLPELKDSTEDAEKPRPITRDFKELSTGTTVLYAKTVMGVLVALVLSVIMAAAYYLYMKGRRVAPAAAVSVETPAPIE